MLTESKNAKKLLLSEVLDKTVQTQSGITLGKLKDLVFVDDPKYAEVTSLLVGRSLGRPPLIIPWTSVVFFGKRETIVEDPPDGAYPETTAPEDLLLLRGKILDKKILDLGGLDVDVVYDLQLLLIEKKLFIIAADVSRNALMHRLGLGFVAKYLLDDAAAEHVIPYRYVQPLGSDLTDTRGALKLTVTKERLRDIHHEDVADILEELSHEDRINIFGTLDSKSAANALAATEPRVQRELLSTISNERITEIFSHLSPAEIAQIISELPHEDSEELQRILRPELASKVHEIITQHDAPASALAMQHFLGFPGDLTVDEAFTRFRREARGADVTMYIYVIDSGQHLRGVVDINELLQADSKSKLEEIMTQNVVSVSPTARRGEIEALFLRYRFRAIPMVDESHKILGVIREKGVFLPEGQ